MAIPEAYVNNVGNLAKFLEEIRSAGVPDRVTFEFLKTLGFTSSNDRPIISVLKGIGFLDQNGSPTDAYKAYRDHNEGPKVLANSLRSAYADLFLANTKANDLAVDKLKGIIATKVSKGEQVVKLIASTFKTLCKAADFSDGAAASVPLKKANTAPEASTAESSEAVQISQRNRDGQRATLHYNIQIHLPTTTDISVYNAIFKSLKESLL